MAPVAVIDTDVFGALFVSPGRAEERRPAAAAWRQQLEGARIVISFQTRAELLAGAQIAGWGGRRVADLRGILDGVGTIAVDSEVIDAYAELTAASRRSGHAIHAKIHTADRWIAACAAAKRLPLLSGDNIFSDVPGLRTL